MVVSSVLCLYLIGIMPEVFLRLETSQHTLECFCVPYRNSKKFKSYVKLHHSWKNYSSQEQKVLEKLTLDSALIHCTKAVTGQNRPIKKQQLQKNYVLLTKKNLKGSLMLVVF